MKKLLILISLILCLGTSAFAANDELGLYFVFPFNMNQMEKMLLALVE